MSMPSRIEIMQAKTVSYEVEQALQDGYLAFAYPGKFVGWGETMEEALHMARMRLRSVRKKFLETHHKEGEWHMYATNRHEKMDKLHDLRGIKLESTWNEENVDKS